MAFTLPDGLAPEVFPLAWLVGRWRGHGFVSYPNIPRTAVVQEVVVDHDGGPYLSWSSTLWVAPEDGGAETDDAAEDRVWGTETGFWRVPPDRPEGLDASRHPVELLLTDPAGHLSLYAGAVGNGRIDLVSDLIARTPDAAEVSAATRLLGLVEGRLLWTWDMAAFGEPLQSYVSAELDRVV
ncbi:heme-binding beta-barrel domain-containing protein [Cellulomonas bogoriensis]|uniref:Ferric nitrobindin-like protein n=1 Tax=Cellulomonas bogoriensis 69B4 = DSM 16987 TaxID=1386082 RepID=A0A0A0C1N9_9CELL|nr:FABP family protein [Cellulomonas bogoriensis]KGM13882.1 hypothetical protein N869_08525 [Cellulomonas bogoriensis 69B4 = DSM 16987]